MVNLTFHSEQKFKLLNKQEVIEEWKTNLEFYNFGGWYFNTIFSYAELAYLLLVTLNQGE